MVDGHTFCRMSAVDIQLCGCGFFFLFIVHDEKSDSASHDKSDKCSERDRAA